MKTWKPKKRNFLLGTVVSLAILLVLLYVMIPWIIKYYLNEHVLKDLGKYTGHVENVEVELLKGAYDIQLITIEQKDGGQGVPLFQADSILVFVSWEALRNYELLVSTKLTKPQLSFLDAKSDDDEQTGEGVDWLAIFNNILPTTLHEFTVENGTIAFRNLDTTPKVDVRATSINGYLTNLTNVKDKSGRRAASAEISAELVETARLNGKAEFDPFDFKDFLFAASAEQLKLREINDFAKVYGGLDFADGEGEIFTELQANDGTLDGYLKVLFEDIDIFSWSQDVIKQGNNPLQLLFEGLAGTGSALLTNLGRDRIATNIAIEGSVAEPDISVWQVIGSLLRNSFIDAIKSGFQEETKLTSDIEALDDPTLKDNESKLPESPAESPSVSSDENQKNQNTGEQSEFPIDLGGGPKSDL